MRRRPRVLAATVVAVVLSGATLGACGGGNDGPRLSAKALDRKAAAICAAVKTESDRLRGAAVAGATGRAAAKEIDATVAALDTQIRGFDHLRGPASTDDSLDALVRHLEAAAAGLRQLSDAAVRDDLTVDQAIQANPSVVHRVNRASAQAADDLVALGWLDCIGVEDG